MPLTIALDGPVGAGKSSVADEAARRLGILHLDTGAMYRATGLYTLRQEIPLRRRKPYPRWQKRCVLMSAIPAGHSIPW